MSARRFTGERLHADDALFAIDLARHRAAYEFAAARLPGPRVLDLGCGGGHGTALLAERGAVVVGTDRVAPDPASRTSAALFCRGDVRRPPLRAGGFDLVVSFQVIEHLEDPSPFLRAIGALLTRGGTALLSTPNRHCSDGVNPHHAREYLAEELRALLTPHFGMIELLGVGASEPVRRHLAARSRRIRTLLRLDPLRLRERLPRAWVERAFAWSARWVRRRARRVEGAPPVTWRDYPIGPPDEASSLDWLAVCREPRR